MMVCWYQVPGTLYCMFLREYKVEYHKLAKFFPAGVPVPVFHDEYSSIVMFPGTPE